MDQGEETVFQGNPVMKLKVVVHLLILSMTTILPADVYHWTGAADNDVFNELNWERDGSPGTNIPQIDPAVPVNQDLVISSGTPVISGALLRRSPAASPRTVCPPALRRGFFRAAVR